MTNLKAYSTLLGVQTKQWEMLLFADIHQSYLQRSWILLSLQFEWKSFVKFMYNVHSKWKQIALPDTREKCAHSISTEIYWRSQTICICAVMFSFNRKSIHIPTLLRYTKYMDCYWANCVFRLFFCFFFLWASVFAWQCFVFNWQGNRKEAPVKNVNILKLMTLKTNGLS